MAESVTKQWDDEQSRDLGLSGRIALSKQKRIMRPDGSLNVVRLGHGFWQSLNIYQHMITVTWPRFFGYVFIFYVIANAIFASLFVAAGPGAIQGGESGYRGAQWHNAIFFSVQTIATIGYGQMTPKGTIANSLVAVEALSGLLGFALITGLLFARFSRPSAQILRSKVALIAPYKHHTALMFRIANGRVSQLIDLKAIVTYSWMDRTDPARPVRRFLPLPLERDGVVLLPTQWVIVHPIDEKSPFYGRSQQQILTADPEVFVALSALDETFSQTVHARFSYADSDIVHGAKFVDLFGTTPDGVVTIDLAKLSDHHPMRLPGVPGSAQTSPTG
ncbi:MAG: transporter [Acidobacteria bacterium]|nr:transporter [Acidobacteriota bacterium]